MRIFVELFGESQSATAKCVTEDYNRAGAAATEEINPPAESLYTPPIKTEEIRKPIITEKKKKSKFKIFIWFVLGAIIFFYFSGQL